MYHGINSESSAIIIVIYVAVCTYVHINLTIILDGKIINKMIFFDLIIY